MLPRHGNVNRDFCYETTVDRIMTPYGVDDFNGQAHWAHWAREDGRRTPAEVLDRVVARPVDEADLHRVFYTLDNIRN
jgi:hypothetical protein